MAIDFGNKMMTAFTGVKKIDSYIMVIGVGGAGCNVVEDMHTMGIHNVMFMVCNTDTLALNKKPIELKIPLGVELTQGLGAGADPQIGRDSALETESIIRKTLIETKTRMAFITAGMGGGTGTGASPEIARICRELGILTVGFVTIPRKNEGPKRMSVALEGLREIVKYLDSILIVDNQSVVENFGNLRPEQEFKKANDILAESAKGVAEIITIEVKINVDFADVRTTLKNSGITLMGTSMVNISEDCDYVEKVMKNVMNSPLLMQTDIAGARQVLMNITWGGEGPLSSDLERIVNMVQEEAGGDNQANIIYGRGRDSAMNDGELKVTLVATGFENNKDHFSLYTSRNDTDANSNVIGNVINRGVISEMGSGLIVEKEKPVFNKPLSSTKFNEERVNIKPENVKYIKSLSLSEVENTPAYKRYKIDIKHMPNNETKKVIKLEQ